jgi:hypothetical protein
VAGIGDPDLEVREIVERLGGTELFHALGNVGTQIWRMWNLRLISLRDVRLERQFKRATGGDNHAIWKWLLWKVSLMKRSQQTVKPIKRNLG